MKNNDLLILVAAGAAALLILKRGGVSLPKIGGGSLPFTYRKSLSPSDMAANLAHPDPWDFVPVEQIANTAIYDAAHGRPDDPVYTTPTIQQTIDDVLNSPAKPGPRSGSWY